MGIPCCHALARLLDYPERRLIDDLQIARNELRATGLSEAEATLSPFSEDVAMHTLHELQERYTQTFDLTGDTTLETGWHLFGEQYARGIYLAKLRLLLAAHGIAEEGRLPDHLGLALRLLQAMPDGDAEDFAEACVRPACATLRTHLERIHSPYIFVLDAATRVLASRATQRAAS